MKKIFVFGCSVSDYCMVDKNYSDYLIDEGYDVRKNTRGGGSNGRSFRVLHTLLRENKIDSNDRIVFQYTNPHRVELPVGDEITDWKFDSWEWQGNYDVKRIHKVWENNCVNESYEKEVFLNQCYITELLLISLNIPTLWLTSGYVHPIDPKQLPLAKHRLFSSHNIIFGDKTISDDGSHFTDYGHREMAQIIKNWEIKL